MNVYKRDKGGPYWYRFMLRGVRIQRSSGVYNKADAMDIASAFRTQLVKGEVGISEPEPKKEAPRFDSAMVTFLAWSEQQYTSHPASHKRYVTSSKALLRHFTNKPLDKIDSDDVEAFKLLRRKQKKRPAGRAKKRTSTAPIKPATVNRELALLVHLFNHFDGLLEGRNPARKVKKLEEDNFQDRVLTFDEERLYLLACSQPVRDIAIMMLQTGMRPSEICGLRRENVFLSKGYLVNRTGKTKAARRKVWLTETALNVLARRLEQSREEWVFPGRVEGKPIVKFNAGHNAAVKRSGVARFTPYCLRHTWATRAAQSGVDLMTLKSMLGHSSMAMLSRYVHPTEQHQADAMRKIQAKAQAS